jgi:hypothetical protein
MQGTLLPFRTPVLPRCGVGDARLRLDNQLHIIPLSASFSIIVISASQLSFSQSGPILAAAIPQNRDLALKEGKKDEAIENLLGVRPFIVCSVRLEA